MVREERKATEATSQRASGPGACRETLLRAEWPVKGAEYTRGGWIRHCCRLRGDRCWDPTRVLLEGWRKADGSRIQVRPSAVAEPSAVEEARRGWGCREPLRLWG